MNKINLGIIFGGKSAEHEISLRSAASMLNAVNREKYNIHLIGISRDGKWYLKKDISSPTPLLAQNQTEIILKKESEGSSLIDANGKKDLLSLDVVFPIMHGSYGEDGTIQGFLKAVDLPFVGVDLMASAVGMDKDMSKRIWRDAGIPIARYHCIRRAERQNVDSQLICKDLGLPVFVKPANAGSSVGVKKVNSEKDLLAAIDHALLYDHKVLIEEAIIGIEIECAILGNEYPRASVLGEIIPQSEFYSYEAKYLDDHGAVMHIPAEIQAETVHQIQAAAILAFKSIGAEGLSRVDFFLKPDGSYVINEINTMPGFTEISMYPKLWEHTGISYSNLIDQLITLALERHQRDKNLKTSFD
ncbi:MAG: D-alanine--D-alanine ligase [Saprospiraceae bacterium]|nr:D-alanine--D-alanine ligase [Saprospiraceae bacterium]MBK7810553.1 D-alanine--D-alanine ligase [Saprospiraceae bacterium]MBK9630143.1 D-alanine--D-alanine ligase [Saprospiraceae bacterium]